MSPPEESATEREARVAAEREDPAAAAGALLRAGRSGALATLSLHNPGYPFGSVAPYALSARGEPLLVMSSIAQHTKNALADPRASLLVQESGAPGDDVQALGRVTVLGRISAVPAGEAADARARYLARHPQAARTAGGHDFNHYQLSIEEVRFIGGFGKICWIPGQSMLLDLKQDPLAPHAKGICQHMNDDHAAALALFCQRFRSLPGVEARMVGVDRFGFDVEHGDRERVRFDFEQPLSTTDEVRRAMVSMVRAARA
jgi:putative heme iron utilization protein